LGGFTLQVDQNLQTQALAILTSNCASCHDTASNGGVTQILDVNHLIVSGLVVPGNPTGSQLITACNSLGMPPAGPLAPASLTVLENWISSMKLVGTAPPVVGPAPNPLPPGKVVQDDPTLHTQAMNIININCAGCHENQGAKAGGGISSIMDINVLVASGLVVAGDPSQGSMLAAISAGTMPKGGGARVTAADLQTLKNWVASMTIVNDVGQAAEATRPALSATFTGVFTNIIQPKCFACHGPVLHNSANFSSGYSSVSGDAGNILSQCQGGDMPQSPYPTLTASELAALQGWINAGKPNN
jgi:mono/diheme cytochrome c family protein